MNLLLIPPHDIDSNGCVNLGGRRALHILNILKLEVGSQLRVGVDNTWIGSAQVLSLSNVQIDNRKSGESPKKQDASNATVVLQLLHTHGIHGLPGKSCELKRPWLDVILSMPRPKVFDKVLQTMATLGVGRIIVTPTSRVENAYFSSPKMSVPGITEALRLGLEQASVDPFFPYVIVYASWKRFLKELVPRFILTPSNAEQNERSSTTPFHKLLVLHPDQHAVPLWSTKLNIQRHSTQGPLMIAIGPEGGFLDEEVQDLQTRGFKTCQLGTRILKVETAIVTAVSQISLLLNQTSDDVPFFRRTDLQPFQMSSCWCNADHTHSDIPRITLPIKGPHVKKPTSPHSELVQEPCSS